MDWVEGYGGKWPFNLNEYLRFYQTNSDAIIDSDVSVFPALKPLGFRGVSLNFLFSSWVMVFFRLLQGSSEEEISWRSTFV